MYLLDTVVLPELRKRRRNTHLVARLEWAAEQDLFVSVVTIAEIERGIERQRHLDPTSAEELDAWLGIVLRVHADHILPGHGSSLGPAHRPITDHDMDLAIAATALERGLTVMTRNVADFRPTGIMVVDPFIARQCRHRA
jgi:toxin FitB